jgi:hypothetical protein
MTRINIRQVYNGTYLRWYLNGYHYWEFSDSTQVVATSGEKFATSGKKMLSMSSLNLDLQEVTGLRSLLVSKDVQLYKDGNWINARVLPGSQIIFGNSVNGYEIEVILEVDLTSLAVVRSSVISGDTLTNDELEVLTTDEIEIIYF